MDANEMVVNIILTILCLTAFGLLWAFWSDI